MTKDTGNTEADAAAGTANIAVTGVSDQPLQNVSKKELSKRQRRKLPNDKHKWPQHPKIQSMEARHKAYIRTAGLGSLLDGDGLVDNGANTRKNDRLGHPEVQRKKIKSASGDFIDPSLDLMSPEVKFGRILGGADQRSRHAAVLKLKHYMRARCDIDNENGGLSEMDLLKLFKGLWFTLYMCDKVPVQDELSKQLASLIWCVAGTEEEDEYAGQAYMDLCGPDDDGDGDGDLVGGSFEEEEEEDDDDDDSNSDDNDLDGDEEIVMREVYNSVELNGSDLEDDSEVGGVDGDRDDSGFGHGEADIEDHDEMEIRHCRGAHLASLFIKTFFHTIRREWGKMDKYRVDKFYTLIRLCMHEVFKYMARRHWNIGIIRLFNDTIFDEVLSKTPNGLRYHLIDLVLEELSKVNAVAPIQLTEATFLDTMEPYFAMAQTGAGGDDSVQARVLEKILSMFLDQYSFVSNSALEVEGEQHDDGVKASSQDKSGEARHIFCDVHVQTVAQFIFELASDADTPDRYRKSLYDMHKKYMRRVKKVGRDVALTATSDDDDWMEACEGEVTNEGAEEDDARNESPRADTKNTRKLHEDSQYQNEAKKRNRTDSSTKIGGIEKSQDGSFRQDMASNGAKKAKRRKTKPMQSEASKPQVSNRLEHNREKEIAKVSTIQYSKEEDGVDDEVVTISIQEQKRARLKTSLKPKTNMKDDFKGTSTGKQESSEKRVKFTAVNRSKSWKASMKALVTTTPPKTSVTTPERGILLNKGAAKSSNVSKKAGRQRAINYF